ncbi:MAG: transporter [Pseudomonadota bacterium]
MTRTLFTAAALAALFATAPARADHEDRAEAKDHAPIGVMGDHRHKKGEFMLSYRFMRMRMGESLIGTDAVPAATIATTVPNRFANPPMSPPTLRVVPTDMAMDMHMVGAMWAPTDRVTLMAMGTVLANTMDHVTFQGPAGATPLGQFTTETSGFGDTKIAALIGLFDGRVHSAHLNAGFSVPTGSITEEDDVLTPMGTRPTIRTPYPMQLGSGTWDLEPGITYLGEQGPVAWGAQYRATLRTGENDEGYALGDIHQTTAWASYGLSPSSSVSARVAARTQGRIDGIDPQITAPVQTANPDFQGGERIELGAGLNLMAQSGPLSGHRVSVEALLPVYQDLNGPQMRTDWTLTVGWQKAF